GFLAHVTSSLNPRSITRDHPPNQRQVAWFTRRVPAAWSVCSGSAENRLALFVGLPQLVTPSVSDILSILSDCRTWDLRPASQESECSHGHGVCDLWEEAGARQPVCPARQGQVPRRRRSQGDWHQPPDLPPQPATYPGAGRRHGLP